MDYDEYGEVINGVNTFVIIAETLNEHGHLLIGWTDEMSTHFDILFTDGSLFAGANHQGGIKPNALFVSIMRLGAFGFKKDMELHPSYISEKLGCGGGVTTEKLAELINGIIAQLK